MILRTRRRCPRCAEAVRREALVCRYCASPLEPALGKDSDARPCGRWVGAIAGAVALVGLVGYAIAPRPSVQTGAAGQSLVVTAAIARPSPVMPPSAPALTGRLHWSAATAPTVLERSVGPLTVQVRSAGSGDEVAPAVTVRFADQQVTMTGERRPPTAVHDISAFGNRPGAAQVIMLQSFSGGAHCCNHVQLAGLVNGALKVVDLGEWDGDAGPDPVDRSGDGVADFVFDDQAFLYAFAPYAMSMSVPVVLNVVGGKVVDVSQRPAFRPLFLQRMRAAGAICRTGTDGDSRNGACAAYVAAAARADRLAPAWSDMLAGYDATAQWNLPVGCAVPVARDAACPPAEQVTAKSYPEALLGFLQQRGYISRRWQPSGARRA